jgi:hypothetical protein
MKDWYGEHPWVVALLETVPQVTLPEQSDAKTQHSRIQVLNFIVLPSDVTTLPVLWDFLT